MRNHLRSFTCLLVVFFLFTAIVSRALAAAELDGAPKQQSYSKGAMPVKADTQLPFEEKEEEKEQEKKSDSEVSDIFFLYLAIDFFPSAARHFVSSPYSGSPRFCGNRPVYLAKRTFLI